VKTFFGGSVRQMMTALVAEEKLTGEELDALSQEIQRARQERKKDS
jgi:hypothetical protein